MYFYITDYMPRLVTPHMMGGLGNQLFQIATAYAYAKDNGLELALPSSWADRADRPPIWSCYLDISKWKNMIGEDQYNQAPWLIISESGFEFKPLPPPPNHTWLCKLFGYFQSSLYFSKYKDELRVALQPGLLLLAESHQNLKDVGAENTESWIVAHVRRGDYVNCADYHLVCTPEYYNGARALIEERTGLRRVCWVTDDFYWVQANLHVYGDVILSGDSSVDFTNLTQFRHMILSNSSYSWWASWLNPRDYKDRIICCPNRWFGPSGPQKYETVYEPSWLRIDTTSGNLEEQL
jgi:hypothetical protein